jgi:uncharacterized protein YdeI (YjbR/CyaY-like superfamily)
MKAADGLDIVEAPDRDVWRAWLERHGASEKGAWLVMQKKNSSTPGVTYDEAVEEALCFGWIDSRANRADETTYLQIFTPRKPGGTWAATNKVRVERLIAEGRMTPAGMALIESAKADGSWNALDDIEALKVPDDLTAALAENPDALANFEAFPASAKKIILLWIASAKRAETRAKRIAETADKAARNERAAQWQRPEQRKEERS